MPKKPKQSSAPGSLRVMSWNVNGLRAAAGKGFLDWLAGCDAQIVGLQEVRALPDQLPDAVRTPPGFHTHFHPAERKPGQRGRPRLYGTKVTLRFARDPLASNAGSEAAE